MRTVLRFVCVLVVLLALACWYASGLIERKSLEWFERDTRAQVDRTLDELEQPLSEALAADQRERVERALGDLQSRAGLLGAAVLGPEPHAIASTQSFPRELCDLEALRARGLAQAGPSAPWAGQLELASGATWLRTQPIAAGMRGDALLLVAQDSSSLVRRQAQMRRFLLAVFAGFAAISCLATIVAARLSYRSLYEELRRILGGEAPRNEFHPLLSDVRDLVERIGSEREAEAVQGDWGPERLRQTLNRYLRGERVAMLANREPYIHVRRADGAIEVEHPASGLVTALEPVMRACSGVWIAHGAGSADRETVDRHDRVRVPPEDPSYSLRRLWLSEEEERGYYYGFANEGLWPLCHISHARPVFRAADFRHYQAVNERFAEATAEEVDGHDPIVLVQDYHFACAPRLIRERLPRAAILTFWHIPWPNSERFGICPFREQLLEGLLGSSILGFHTQLHCNNFLESVDRYLEARIDRVNQAVVLRGHRTLVRPYPISVEWPVHWLRDLPPAAECRREVFERLGLRADALLGVGVDRLDYTKGIEERFLAVERLLERHPEYVGRFVFVQLAAPSRSLIPAYRALDEAVAALAQRICERFAQGAYRPIVLLRGHHEPPQVYRFLRAADLCYVSSLHDGMNLVAKEFVAAREDERGVLVLSQFTGAAAELTEALIVNPYDLEESSEALQAALEMSPAEQRSRLRALRGFVAEFNVYRWAGRMIRDAAQLRGRDRIADRIAHQVRRGARLWR